MNAQAASTDFGTELSIFIRRINTFDSFARSTRLKLDATGRRPVKCRGMSPATVTVAGAPTRYGITNAVPCPESIGRLCAPTSHPRPGVVAPEGSSSIRRAREKEMSTNAVPRVLVTDGTGLYEVTALTPEIVRSSEWQRDGDRIGTWSALFGPKGRYSEASRGQQLGRLRADLSSLPAKKRQAAILMAQKASLTRNLSVLKPITIHSLFLNNRLENVWTNVYLRLRPVQRSNESQVDSDIWTLGDSIANRLAPPCNSSMLRTAF